MSDPALNIAKDQPPTPPVDTPGATAVAEPSLAEAIASVSVADEELSGWPSYARGLLKVRVPVRVTLASQRKSIQEIVELGPGSIVKFDKTCNEPLDLMVGDRLFAQGEVVKVGDKFGLRIRGLVAETPPRK